jgi:MFS family permease
MALRPGRNVIGGLLSPLRELSPRIRTILAVNAVNSFGGGLVFPFLWIYLTQARGLAEWVPAVTLALQAGTAVAGGLAWGALTDKLPHRWVVPLVMTVAGIGTGLYAVAVDSYLALLAAVVYGLGISGVGTVLRTLYAGARTSRERGIAFSTDFAVFNVMTGVGVIVGGIIAQLAFAPAADRYAGLYLGDAATFLFTAVALAVLLPRTVPAPEQQPAEREPGGQQLPAADPGAVTAAPRGYAGVLRERRVAVLLMLLTVCSLVSYGQFRSGLPGYLTAHRAVSAGGISAIFVVNIVVAVLVQVVLGKMRTIGRGSLLTATGGFWAVGWALVLVAGQRHGAAAVTAAAVGVVLLSIGEGLAFPVTTTMLNDLAPEALRGRVNALISVSISGGTMIGPLIAGAALPWDRGIPFLAGIIAACVLLAAAGTGIQRTAAGDATARDATAGVELEVLP